MSIRTKGFKLLVGSFLVAGSLQANASTLDCNVAGCTNIDAFDVFLAGLGVGGTVIPNVNEFGWTGYVLSDFGAGSPTVTGSTFTDYIVLSLQSYKDAGGTTISSGGLIDNYEISIFMEATGTITNGTTGAFSFTGVNDIDLFYDLGPTTTGNFLTNLSGFLDGTEVVTETGFLASLTTLPIANTGVLDPTLGASGEFNLQAGIDTPTGVDFLRDAGTTDALTDVYNNVIALTAAEVTFQCQAIEGTSLNCNSDTMSTIFGNFEDIYGPFTNATLQTLVSTTPDTNLAVPEPEVLMLLSVALLGLGVARRKKKLA